MYVTCISKISDCFVSIFSKPIFENKTTLKVKQYNYIYVCMNSCIFLYCHSDKI